MKIAPLMAESRCDATCATRADGVRGANLCARTTVERYNDMAMMAGRSVSASSVYDDIITLVCYFNSATAAAFLVRFPRSTHSPERVRVLFNFSLLFEP